MSTSVLKLGLLGVFWASLSFGAGVTWEAAIIFLGTKLPSDYQADIDRNILDLAKSHPNDTFHLSIFREFENRAVTYYIDSKSPRLQSWKPLFSNGNVADIQVPGELISESRAEGEQSIINRSVKLADFFQRAFQEPSANRVLLLYDHGQAFEGLGSGVSLLELKEQLVNALPQRAGKPLDILWMDACYMANLESVFELRKLSKLIIGSQEAEFSAGAPMEMFKSLSYGERDISRVAFDFAERFIESYSYMLQGSKRKAVFSSSATISIVDTSKLESLVASISSLKEAIGHISKEQIAEIRKEISELSMERKDLLDLGSLVLRMSKSRVFSSNLKIREALFNIRTKLDLGKPNKTRTNPRLVFDPERMNSSAFVFGYNQWQRGDEKDTDTLEKLPEQLKQDVAFVSGPYSKNWPKRELNHILYFSPFSVGLNIFHFYSSTNAGKRTSSIKTFKRERDFVIVTRETRENPILFSGYTQGVGKKAERYTGLSIADPTAGLPSFDYSDLEFYKATGWSN